MNPDKAYENLLKVHERYNFANFNEADTRGKIIDIIFKECLGWKENNISREPHVVEGYIDYVFKVNDIPKFVVEAKKTGVYFEIPEDRSSRHYKINGIISTIPELISAVEQARHYCDETGAKFGVVTNGKQYVIFQAITEGKPWRDGKCVIFKSLDDILQNFALFYNMLNIDSVTEGALNKHIGQNRLRLEFKKPIEGIGNPDYTWSRNELYTYIRPIAELAFDEMLDDPRALTLKECYVHEKTDSTQSEMEAYFADKLPYFSHQLGIADICEGENDSGKLQKIVAEKFQDRKGSLVVLLGGIGVGKSTFIHRYYKVILASNPNFLWFYIDFRTIEPRPEEIEKYVYKKIHEQWIEKYCQVDATEAALSSDVESLKDEYIERFRRLKKAGYSLSIAIDNIDQHDVKMQEVIFLHASSICDQLRAITLIAVRENTFLMSTRLGVFDAYHIPKFHISSPNFLRLIVKRINYAIQLLRVPSGVAVVDKIPASVKLQLIDYFGVIKSSLKASNKEAKSIVRFIDNISVGNMREALRMFNNFIVSGNTNIPEIFDKLSESGTYQIAFHQFIKSILLGERRYYDQDKSNILNLFDFDISLSDSHANLLRVLSHLYNKRNSQSEIGTGYVSLLSVVMAGSEVNISKECILDSIARLSKFSLVELDNLSKTDIHNATFVKITHAGAFYLNELLYQFVYLDAVLSDTPISDSSVTDRIVAALDVHEIPDRIIRCEFFTTYLKDAEEAEFSYYPEFCSNSFSQHMFMKLIHNEFLLQQPRILSNYRRHLAR